MNRRQKIIVSVTGIFLVLLLLVGLTYAYFLTRINGNEETKSISVTTANLALVYGDGNGILQPEETIIPGTTVSSKTFTVKNEGNAETDYAVILENFNVTYATTSGDQVAGTATTLSHPDDFKLIITCTSDVDGKTCNALDDTLPTTNDILVTNKIAVGETQSYELTLEYLETGTDQSADMNKTIEGKINIIDTASTIDIEGTLASYSAGDYVQVNSVPKVSQLTSDGKYKVTGVEPGSHTIEVYSSNGTKKGTQSIEIVKGDTAGVSGNVITMTEESRTATVDITDTYEITIDSEIAEYSPFEKGTLAYEILKNAKSAANNNDSVKTIYSPTPLTTPGTASKNTEKTLSEIEENGGTSYYFRGNVTDNYVTFNEMCWRIVRIENDGSVKIILEDSFQPCRNHGLTPKNSLSTSIGNGDYGYTIENGSMVKPNYFSESETSMKTILDDWLKNNFSTKKQELLKEDNWCLGYSDEYKYEFDTDTQKYNLITDDYINEKYNQVINSIQTEEYYMFSYYYNNDYIKLSKNQLNNLNCEKQEISTSKIGGLTAGEVALAGAQNEKWSQSSLYYLISDEPDENLSAYATISISYFDFFPDPVTEDNPTPYFASVYSYSETLGIISGTFPIFDNYAIRPAITLKPDTKVVSFSEIGLQSYADYTNHYYYTIAE